jgi:hypothetical protein
MRFAAFCAVLAACSAPASPAAPVAPATLPAPIDAADAAPVTATRAAPGIDGGVVAPGTVLLSTTANLDGADGDESIALLADGTLRAGDLSFRVDLGDPAERNAYFWDRDASLRAVVFEARRNALLLTTPTAEAEDPPSRFQLFIVRGGKLVRVFDQVIGVYNSPDIAFPGDGTLRYVEQGWMACERAKHPSAPVAKQEVVHRLDRGGTRMIEWRRIATREKQDCSQLSACPFVYAVTDAGATRVGEILRDLRGARAYSLQSLVLPRGTTHIRLAEEKPEVTYLDEIVLEAGGVEIRPLACRGAPVPAYCRADRVPYVLRRGDSLDLVFDSEGDGEVTLFARGYYVPAD